MKTLMSRILLGLAVFGLSAVSLSANVNNGQFFTPPPGSFTNVTGAAISGWTIGGNVDWIGTYWQRTPGINYGGNPGYSIDLDGSNAASSVSQSQSIATTAGSLYTLSFVLSGNPDGPPAVKNLDVITGGTVHSFTYDMAAQGNTRADMKWAPISFSFTATGPSTTITFQSTDNSSEVGSNPNGVSFGPAIGDVFVTPEPGFYGVLALGLCGVVVGLTRRRRA